MGLVINAEVAENKTAHAGFANQPLQPQSRPALSFQGLLGRALCKGSAMAWKEDSSEQQRWTETTERIVRRARAEKMGTGWQGPVCPTGPWYLSAGSGIQNNSREAE